MGLLNIFGIGNRQAQIAEMMSKGAVIVDVRTRAEFGQGHVEGAINVPLDELERKISKLKKLHKPLVLCCASGSRSGIAKRILVSNGLECANAGTWLNLCE